MANEVIVKKIEAIKDTYEVSVGGSVIGQAASEAEGKALGEKYLNERR